MSQKRRKKTDRRRGRPRRAAHHHDRMCDACLAEELRPMVDAMLDVLDPDDYDDDCEDELGDDLAEAVENGRMILLAVLAGAGDGHHHVTVTTSFGSALVTGDVHDAQAHLDNSNHQLLIAWTHLGAADMTQTRAGIALRSVTDAGTQVRGWHLHEDGEIEPLDEAAIFSAYCTDHKTGEPLAPEFGVEYCAAYPLDV